MAQGVHEVIDGNDGKIYIAGTLHSVNGVPRRYLARLHSNGELDEAYAPPLISHGSAEGGILQIAQQADGKILMAGMFLTTTANRGIFERFNTDGSLDLSFFGRGVYFCDDLRVLPDGNILHAASTQFNSEYAVLRVFDPSGAQVQYFRDENRTPGILRATLVQPDGKILFGGQFINSTKSMGKHLARVHANGLLDSSFDVGSGFELAAGSRDYQVFVNALVFQPDGKLLVGGQFHRYNGQPRTNLVRLLIETVFARLPQVDASGNISLSWETISGTQQFQVESSDDFREWRLEQASLAGRLIQFQTTTADRAKFYRLRPQN